MTVTLCALLWARDGREAELVAYEDRVLQLVPDHGGRLIARARSSSAGADQPFEVHLLEFPSYEALDTYMNDDRRIALQGAREQAIARTEVLRVRLI
jgi:uncharacterized protein (DUF1330 family)